MQSCFYNNVFLILVTRLMFIFTPPTHEFRINIKSDQKNVAFKSHFKTEKKDTLNINIIQLLW